MQNWVEIRVLTAEMWAELVAEVVGRRTAGSVVFGRPNLGVDAAPEGIEWVRGFVLEGECDARLRDGLESELGGLAALVDAPELEGLTATYRAVPHEDWASSWRKSWKPFRVARLAVVTYDWDGPLRADDIVLRLEPAGSFGTGRHATTRMCLRFLQELELDGARVLDAGTGTGILAIAAALLGARECFGFDIDTRSAAAAGDLARRNGVFELCRFATGELAGFEGELDFDVVLANIYSDVIQAHAANLRARMSDGARFAFSGCPMDKSKPTRDAIEAAGLVITSVRQRGRWITFVGHR